MVRISSIFRLVSSFFLLFTTLLSISLSPFWLSITFSLFLCLPIVFLSIFPSLFLSLFPARSFSQYPFSLSSSLSPFGSFLRTAFGMGVGLPFPIAYLPLPCGMLPEVFLFLFFSLFSFFSWPTYRTSFTLSRRFCMRTFVRVFLYFLICSCCLAHAYAFSFPQCLAPPPPPSAPSPVASLISVHFCLPPLGLRLSITFFFSLPSGRLRLRRGCSGFIIYLYRYFPTLPHPPYSFTFIALKTNSIFLLLFSCLHVLYSLLSTIRPIPVNTHPPPTSSSLAFRTGDLIAYVDFLTRYLVLLRMVCTSS